MAVLAAGAALLGLIAGRHVRVLADRFGAAGEGDPVGGEDAAKAERGSAAITRARRAEAREAFREVARTLPVPAWPPTVEGATAVVCTLIGWRLAGQEPWLVGACLYAAIAGTALAVIDWRTKRLPDAITLPSYAVLLALLLPSGTVVHAIYGMLALGAVYAVLWFVSPHALGLGDVKLAGLIGLVTGALGLNAWIVAAVGGHLLGALYALGLLITRRGTLKSEFPFGPFMLAAALAGILVP